MKNIISGVVERELYHAIFMGKGMDVSKFRTYKANEIPQVNIDYRGLVDYARSVGREICELSDKEKERFIVDLSMEDVRRIMLK